MADLSNHPVIKRLPCPGCRFLEPVFHAGEQEPSKSYMRCVYQPPKVPAAYWQYRTPYAEPAQWRNVRYMHGPFSETVEDVFCEVREDAPVMVTKGN